MNIIPKLVVMSVTAMLLYFTDIPPQPLKLPLTVQLVPEAEGSAGCARTNASPGCGRRLCG